MKVLDTRIEQKRKIYDIYSECFKDNKYIAMIPEPQDCRANHWLSGITLSEDCKVGFMDIINALAAHNIESRPAWKPMHTQPVFKNCDFFSHNDSGESVSENLFRRSVCLPSDSKMTEEQVRFVAKVINDLIK